MYEPATYIFGFIALISVIVVVHEMGHFWVARWCGVKVETFSLGFGKVLLRRKDRQGTSWELRLLPLGGYVSFRGDMNPASTKHIDEDNAHDAYHTQPLWKRMSIIIAGPMANFIFAFVVITAVLWAEGKVELSARVDKVTEDSPAQVAGLMPGDWFVSVDGEKIDSFHDVQRRIGLSAGDQVNVVVNRNDVLVPLTVVPEKVTIDDNIGGTITVGRIGVVLIPDTRDRNRISYTLPQAIVAGAHETWKITSDTGRFIRRLFYDEDALQQVSGPIRIAKVSGTAVQHGTLSFLQIMVILSINVGLLNLLPIPVLDGGHLMMGLYEAIARGKPSPRIMEIAYRGGGIVLLALFLLAMTNDIVALDPIGYLGSLFS